MWTASARCKLQYQRKLVLLPGRNRLATTDASYFSPYFHRMRLLCSWEFPLSFYVNPAKERRGARLFF